MVAGVETRPGVTVVEMTTLNIYEPISMPAPRIHIHNTHAVHSRHQSGTLMHRMGSLLNSLKVDHQLF